jgi:hypothetical protein
MTKAVRAPRERTSHGNIKGLVIWDNSESRDNISRHGKSCAHGTCELGHVTTKTRNEGEKL